MASACPSKTHLKCLGCNKLFSHQPAYSVHTSYCQSKILEKGKDLLGKCKANTELCIAAAKTVKLDNEGEIPDGSQDDIIIPVMIIFDLFMVNVEIIYITEYRHFLTPITIACPPCFWMDLCLSY